MEFLAKVCAIIAITAGVDSSSGMAGGLPRKSMLLDYCDDQPGGPLEINWARQHHLEINPENRRNLTIPCHIPVTLGENVAAAVVALQTKWGITCKWIEVASMKEPETKYDLCRIEPWQGMFEGPFMMYINYHRSMGDLDIGFTAVHPINCIDEQGHTSCNQTRPDTTDCVFSCNDYRRGGSRPHNVYDCDMSCDLCEVTSEKCCYNDGYGETGEDYAICDMFSCIRVDHFCDGMQNCNDGTDEDEFWCAEVKKMAQLKKQKREAKAESVAVRCGGVVFTVVWCFIMAG